MDLLEIPSILQASIWRNGTFSNMGLLSSKSPNLLVYLESEAYLPNLEKKENVSAVITTEELSHLIPLHLGVCITTRPKQLFYSLHNHLVKETAFYGDLFNSCIAESAIIHPSAYIAPHNVRIGERCIVGPKACIMENTLLENDVIIGPGSIVGSEGFGFNKFNGNLEPIFHAGGVKVEKSVEIQANCCIDKAMFDGYTTIGESTKCDNLVYVAHNTKIGKKCLIAAHACITGSVNIGDEVWIGPNSTVIHEITIGNKAYISVGAVVTKDVPDNARVTGNFAIDHNQYIQFLRSIR